uniref:MHC class I-like antigen recognition-like domain-containing protein n=1 Tax=Pseudonaja textilis TaxID=8673 RepID=A0A670ZAL1_PSETE
MGRGTGGRSGVSVAPLLLLSLCASSHSMKYFYTAISDPSQGLPQFVAVAYVDGQVFVHYDSHSRRMQPRVSWMEKVGKEDPQYWDRNTLTLRVDEETFRENLETLRNRYNQSEGENQRGEKGGGPFKGKSTLHTIIKVFF